MEGIMMKVVSIIVILLGVASIVFGVLFITQAASGEKEIAESISPLPLEQLDEQYDTVAAQYTQMRDAGAQASVEFNYLTVQKTGLGLARANVGAAQSVRMNGIIDIILGLGLGLAGFFIFRRSGEY
jgi:hypothetical protein